MKKVLAKMLWLALLSITIADAQNINTPNSNGPMGLQVNTLTGNLFFSRNEFVIPARGFDINIAFSYNSFNFDINNGYGNGWNFLYAIKYKNDTANSKVIEWGDGREDRYLSKGGTNYQSPRGFFNTLTEYQPNKFLLTELEGTKYYFDNATHKRITKMEEPNGNFMSFTYTDTLLTTLTNNAGQSISFSYDAKGRLESVLDAITTPNRIWTYSYDEGNNLIHATDPLGGAKKYAYIVNGPVKSVTDKNNNVIDIIYYPDLTVSELIGCNKRQSFSYDSASQKSIVTDHFQDGQTQVTEYQFKRENDVSWLVGMKSNCCGFNMSFEYDENGNKIKETDANGNSTSYTYDSKGNVLTVTDALNQVRKYTYSNDFNYVTSETDPKGFVTTITYDSKGNISTITEPGNLQYQTTYNANGDIVSSTDPKGNVYTYTYDAFGNPASVSGPNGYHATMNYNSRGDLISEVDSRGNTNSAEFDILNRLKKITDPLNNTVKFNYDAEDNPISITNENNETGILKFDASNRLVQAVDIMGNKSFLEYDGMNNLIAATTAEGQTIRLEYDNRNRLTKATNPLGEWVEATHDYNGNITGLKLPNGQQVIYSYDPLNRLIKTSDASGTIREITYDQNDNIKSIKNATGAMMSAEYDSLNRVKKVTDPLGNFSFMTYDKNGNVATTTDRNGKSSAFTYDGMNRVKTVTDNNGFVTTAVYDNNGNIVSLTDQNSNTTTYTYDMLNRLSKTTYPDGKFREYTYDNKSNGIALRLTDGTTIQFTYDSLYRVIAKTLPDGEVYTYTYDAVGRVKSATNSTGTVTFNYDALSRIISESSNGRTVQYTYNTSGRTRSTIYPDGTSVTYNFDEKGRLTGITENGNPVVNYQYNNVNQLISQTLANGVVTNYQYDFANRLTGYNTSNGTIQNTQFTYDKNQNKTSIARLNAPAKSEQYVFDNNNRLTNYKRGPIGGGTVLLNTYVYDALGNRISANLNGINTTYTPNNLNQVVNSNNGTASINYTYDSRGNLTFDGKYFKTYDAEGKLLKDSASPSNVISYQYDALRRRVQKNTNGQLLEYTFSGLAPIEERSGSVVLNKTLFNNFLSPVSNEKNGSKYFYLQNEMNSVEAITTAQGRVIEHYEYDVYGKLTRFDSLNNILSGSITGNRFGFTGQVYDSSTASYKFFFREYNPETATFNQRDLIGYADGMGMYQYVHNNPANGIDVFGLNDCDENQNKTLETVKEVEKYESWINAISGSYEQLLIKKFGTLERLTKEIGDFTEQSQKIKDELKALTKTAQKFKNLQAILETNMKLGNWDDAIATINKSGNLLNGIKGTQGLNAAMNGLESSLGGMQNSLKGMKNASGKLGALKALGTTLNVADVGIKAYKLINTLTDGKSQGTDQGMAAADLVQSLTAFSPPGAIYNLLDFAQSKVTGKSMNEHISNESNLVFDGYYQGKADKIDAAFVDYLIEHGKYRQYLESRKKIKDRVRKKDCPPNGNNGGTQKKPKTPWSFLNYLLEVISALDPNEIIGPAGEPTKRWVSVHDRLPYTVTYENDKSATAPAKFVKVVAPIHANMDAASFQLGNFGFNNLTFTIPNNTASYYQRLDCRDSLGLYVDITAGYDVQNNQAFWQLQSIDPITLLPPSDPLKGLLLLQDSLQPNNGHGFVNFSIKPRPAAQTLDTIGAKADIIFDANEVIPTNVEMNTIDAYAPTSHLGNLPTNSNNPVSLTWGGVDDVNGCGVKYYTLYVSNDGVNFSIMRSGITRTDTTFNGAPNTRYYFFVLATDSVGNTEVLRPGEVKNTFIGAVLPVTWLYFKGATQQKNNVLNWSTANEQNSKEFKVERSLNGTTFINIGTVGANGNTSSPSSYQYIDYNIDKLNSKVMYYRLKQVDKDNKFNYSSVIRLTYNQEEKSKSIVYPNPTPGTIHVTIGDKKLMGSMAVVVDQNGRVIQNIKITAENQAINLSSYSNGIYYIKLSNKEILKVIKN